MGLLDALSSLLGGGSDSSSSSSEDGSPSSERKSFSETYGSVKRDGNTYEQHLVSGEKGGSHEHTWSSTSPTSHKEGWHGKDFETASNKPKK